MAGKGPKGREAGKVEGLQYASFFVSGERFGIDVSIIKEIIKEAPLKRPKGLPDFLGGLLELRGMAVPVVDLRKRYYPENRFEGTTRIVVTLVDSAVVGLAVDEVIDIEVAGGEDGSGDLPPSLPADLKKCIVGRVEGIEGTAFLLDPSRLFTAGEKKLLLKGDN